MLRILLAEDHDIVRRGIRGVLESQAGWEICAEADNGRDAVRLAAETKPDIAIIDYSLPLLNGLDVVRQTRQVSPGTQSLVFTQHDDDELVRETLRAGARGFLQKSEAADHLVHAVKALALRRPYFTGRVSQVMLANFLRKLPASPILTGREREVVQLIAEGSSNKQIAATLGLSTKTIETHRSAAMRKIGVKNLADLVRYAVRNRIVEP
jgi:DNA-binding NarL/FixJ family response regulator